MSPRARKNPGLKARFESRPPDGAPLTKEEYKELFELGRRMRRLADAAERGERNLDRRGI